MTYIVYIVSMYIYIYSAWFIYIWSTYVLWHLLLQHDVSKVVPFSVSSAPRSRSWTLWTSSATRMLASKKRRGLDPLELFPAFKFWGPRGGWCWVLFLQRCYLYHFFGDLGFGENLEEGGKNRVFFCNNDLGVVEASFWREGSSLQGLVFKRNKGIWDDNHQHIWQ